MLTATSEKQLTDPTWSNPDQISFIIDQVRERVTSRRLHALIGDYAITRGNFGIGHIPIEDRDAILRAANTSKVFELAESMQDRHLQRGIPALYWNWEEIGDHLLTPKMKREPIDGRWGDFTACAGAICLAARAADSEIVTEFNGAIILAGPDTMPIDVEADYRNHWDVLREQREAAQACGQLLQ